MSDRSTVVVVFDQLSPDEFHARLEWPSLIKAWSKAIGYSVLTQHRVELRLAGLDGLDTITVTRRRRGDRVFIGARDATGTLLQSGVWEIDAETGLAVCYRRIYRPDLADVLRERLADFCFSTFVREESLDAAPLAIH